MSFAFEQLHESWLRVSLDGRQGNVRPTMEDAAAIGSFVIRNSTYHVFCILDGHGGDTAVRFISQHMVHELYERVRLGRETTASFMESAVIKAFVKINERLRQEVKQRHHSGTTLSLLLIREYPLAAWTANVGDSTILGCTPDHSKSKKLSVDHKVTLKREQKRVLEHQLEICDQGYICNDKGTCLAMTRALGDFELGDGLLAQPTFRTVDLAVYRIIALASDGLWDVISIKKFPPLLAKYKSATVLNQYRHAKFDQHDNTTILVVQIMADPPQQPTPIADGILSVRIFPEPPNSATNSGDWVR